MNNTGEHDAANQPIGYWLNRCDRAITNAINTRLTQHGVNRIGWQVLNVVGRNSLISTTHLYDLLQTNADCQTLHASVETLLSQGYLNRTNVDLDQLQLTQRGDAFWQQLGEQIATFRSESQQGITEEEFRIMLQVLQRMTHDLEQGQPHRLDLH